VLVTLRLLELELDDKKNEFMTLEVKNCLKFSPTHKATHDTSKKMRTFIAALFRPTINYQVMEKLREKTFISEADRCFRENNM
jgi:hypothetical protein